MYTCPEREFISVYLDNELPENFKKDFETHLENCPECKLLYLSFNKIHQDIQQNNRSITLSDSYIESGFDRLQTKLRFSQSTEIAKPKHNTFNFTTIRRFAPAIAAAVVIALILPIRIMNKESVQKNNTVNSVATITTTTKPPLELMKNRGIVSDLQSATLASFFENDNRAKTVNNLHTFNKNYIGRENNYDYNDIRRAYIRYISKNGNTVIPLELSNLHSMDIFKPTFFQDNENISISISLNPVFNNGQ